MPSDLITENYSVNNAIYKSSMQVLSMAEANHITPLMMPSNSIFKLQPIYTRTPDGVYILDSAYTMQEVYRPIIEGMYDIDTSRVKNNVLMNIYHLDTALCLLFFKEDYEPVLITRNTTVIDNLQCVPGCKIWDTKSYFEITQDNIDNGNVTAAFAYSTVEGYQLKYEMIALNMDNYVIIPYIWYQKFLNDIKQKLESGYVTLRFLYLGTVKTARATRCKIVYDSCVRRAVQYISQYPINELGKLQFATECGDIYCISITDLINVS